MWQEHIDKGVKLLQARQLEAAEHSFNAAMDYAKENFGQYDHRIPETFSHLGQAFLLQKRMKEATSCLRQSSRIASSYNFQSAPVALADYLWAYIDHEEKEPEKRRADSLKVLEKFLKPTEIEAVNKQLKNLFTVKPKDHATESKPEPKPVDPDPTPKQPEPQPAEKPKLESKDPEPLQADVPTKPGEPSTFAETIAQSASQSPEFDSVEPAKFPAERYQAWAEKLSTAIERSQRPHVTEMLGAYVDLHRLMGETLVLYRPPHSAVADHLMAFGDVCNNIGLFSQAGFFYTLTLKNLEKALGADHLKTAYANLYVAMVHRDLDEYDKARHHFSIAFNTIRTKQTNLDEKWFSQVVDSFNLMMHREKIEQQFMAGLDEMISLLKQERLTEFDVLSRSLSDKLGSVFPQDHYNFMLLYRRSAQGLNAAGRTFEAIALSNMADYLDAKLKDKENFNKAFNESFPQFSTQVMTMLCSVLD